MRLAFDEGPAEEIDSVLARSTGWIDPDGWEPADHAYMQSEFQATLLAWLAGLTCPVINRSPAAALVPAPQSPSGLAAVAPTLRSSGAETVVTDDPDTAYAFAGRLEAAGVPGAVCTSLTRDVAWPIGPSDWIGLAAAQLRTPVCLIEPHGRTRPACIVGREVIWDSPPSPEEAALEPRLLSLATEAGLDFLEVATASSSARSGRGAG